MIVNVALNKYIGYLRKKIIRVFQIQIYDPFIFSPLDNFLVATNWIFFFFLITKPRINFYNNENETKQL